MLNLTELIDMLTEAEDVLRAASDDVFDASGETRVLTTQARMEDASTDLATLATILENGRVHAEALRKGLSGLHVWGEVPELFG